MDGQWTAPLWRAATFDEPRPLAAFRIELSSNYLRVFYRTLPSLPSPVPSVFLAVVAGFSFSSKSTELIELCSESYRIHWIDRIVLPALAVFLYLMTSTFV